MPELASSCTGYPVALLLPDVRWLCEMDKYVLHSISTKFTFFLLSSLVIVLFLSACFPDLLSGSFCTLSTYTNSLRQDALISHRGKMACL